MLLKPFIRTLVRRLFLKELVQRAVEFYNVDYWLTRQEVNAISGSDDLTIKRHTIFGLQREQVFKLMDEHEVVGHRRS